MVGYKETFLKINNNFPAYIAICPTVCQFMLTISSTIFNFIVELDNAQLLALVKSILIEKKKFGRRFT